MKKSTKSKVIYSVITIGIILILASVILFTYGAKQQATVGTGTYIQVPTFMYYKCEEAPASSFYNLGKDSKDNDIASSGWTSISCPEFVEFCDITVIGETNTWLGRQIEWKVCNANGGSCNTQENIQVDNNWRFWGNTERPSRTIKYNLDHGHSVYVKYENSFGIQTSGGTLNALGNSFVIYKYDNFASTNGQPYTTIAQGCRFDASTLNQHAVYSLSGTKHDGDITTGSSEDTKYSFREARTFISQFVPISVENRRFVKVNGVQGYCTGNNVYAVATVDTDSGEYQIVDTSGSLNSVLKSGVACCPGDIDPAGKNKCSSSYTWETISGGQCSSFNPCAGLTPFPSGTPKDLKYYNCENGYCVEHHLTAECTSDADCVGNSKGGRCDLSNWQCTNLPNPDVNHTNCTGTQCNNPVYCKSCTEWALNIFKNTDSQCTATDVMDAPTWYNPLTYWRLVTYTGITSQNIVCPLFWLILTIITLAFLVIIYLIFKIIFKIASLFKKTDKKK
jgi:hypothetical protein